MTDKEEESKETAEAETNEKAIPDENMHLFVYGNLLIKDAETGETLVNKSF